LSKWKSSLAGMLAALVVLISPDIASAVGQYADPLLALHMVAAAALFYGYMKSRANGLMILAGLLAGYSAWAKNEGILFIVVFVIVTVLAAWKRVVDWKSLKYLAIGLLIPIMTVALFKAVVASQNDIVGNNILLYQKISDFSRWVVITKSFVAYMIRYANWPVSIFLVLFIYAVLMGFDTRETPYQVLILLLALGQIAGYFFIYLITPHDLELHIGTSIKRLIFHVFPILILWLFIALRVPVLHNRELTE
jgi:4-amino-4-deoxy-L-arabinose transferase-like glycosyltransferase